jgi:Contractile injection system tube protein/LysM domain
MAQNDLKIAYIEALNGKMKGKPIKVLFNPAEYSIEKSNQYQSTNIPGLATPVSQFVSGNADTLTMELFFDTYSPSSRQGSVQAREDVRKYTGQLAALLDIDPGLHAPPICQFIWGGPIGSPEGLQFKAIIEKLSQKFTMFLEDGRPVRATLNVTFKEYKTVADQLKEVGRESSDKSKIHEFKEGDSLWLIAFEEYNDARQWRDIARANKIVNPLELTPGQEIIIPPLPRIAI